MSRSQIRIKDCGFIQDSQVVGAAAHGKPESISEFENYINSEFRQGPRPPIAEHARDIQDISDAIAQPTSEHNQFPR
jgi:hypothetical protein